MVVLLLACGRVNSPDDSTGDPATNPYPVEKDATLPTTPLTTPSSTTTLTSLAPATVVAGTAPRGLDVTITGTGIPADARLSIGPDILRGVVVNETTMQVVIPAHHLAATGLVKIAVLSEQGARSNELTLSVVDAAAAAITLDPSSATARSSSTGTLSIKVQGSGFDPLSVVFFGESLLPTTFESATVLRASVPLSLLHEPRSIAVVVRHLSGQQTAPTTFTVRAAAGTPQEIDCGGRGRCSDQALRTGECVGEFPIYQCQADGCMSLVPSCSDR
jgi:hypothetical protein